MKIIRCISLFLCFYCTGTLLAQEKVPLENSIILDLETENQTIDGFGVGQADWADDVFVCPKRDEILEALFGDDGLRINILRGEIFPHYSDDSLHYDFAVKSDTSMNAVRSAIHIEKNDLLRRGQFWLTSNVHQKYSKVQFVFSVWSPPAWMKIGGYATSDYPASHGKLAKNHYQDFADYLASFYETFQSIGINTYAISPSNEPGYAAPWNSCEWSAKEMGDFIYDYLLPTFRYRNISSKIIFGENPAWSTVFERLRMISSADFVNTILTNHPNMEQERLIAAGHGYVLPDTIPLPAELRRTPIIPFAEAEKRHIPMWVTEISDITPLDTSMEDALYWADMFHKYLTDAHVSAVVWWLGAQPTTTNESLIIFDKLSGEYILSKRYDTFGNYTRYIPMGSKCIENSVKGLPDKVCVSSFKKGKQYSVIIVNPTEEEIKCQLKLKGAQINEELYSYTTTSEVRWKEGRISSCDNYYYLRIPSKSVVTCVGYIQ